MLEAERYQLVLDAPVEQVVGGLFTTVARVSPTIADGQSLHHPPGRVGGAGHVADLARSNQVVESSQRLLLMRLRIESVDEVEIDVVRLQSVERVLAGPQDM